MKIIFATLLIFAPILTGELLACSLGVSPPIYEYFEKTDAVFVGKVSGFRDIKVKKKYKNEDGETVDFLDKERSFRFDVIEKFKGIKGKKVSISVGSLNQICYAGFDVGKTYLVYADGKNESSLIHQWGSNSEELPLAQDQIYFIREFLKGQPEAQVYGSVFRTDNYPNSTEKRVTQIGSIKVVLEGEQKIETLTDEKGYFKFDKISDGKYILKPEVPPIYRLDQFQSKKISISSGKVSVDQNNFGFAGGYNAYFAEFIYGWNNEVSGRIYDTEGKLVKFAAVRLLSPSFAFSKIENSYTFDGYQDREGYSLYSKTPGNYYLVAEIYAPFQTSEKVRVFYQQTELLAEARLISLKATDNLNFDIQLPPEFITKQIVGTIFQFDGKPAEWAQVSLRRTASLPISKSVVEDEEIEDVEKYGYDWDIAVKDGSFTLQAYESFEYWVHVEGNTRQIVEGKEVNFRLKTEPIKIKVGKTNEPLKIFLPKP